MAHPFQFAPHKGQSVSHTRMKGWESVDLTALAKAIEVDHQYLRMLLSGKFQPLQRPSRTESVRVIGLVALALGIARGEVERRIDACKKMLPAE